MAIEKMKKLRLMAIRPQKDVLFRELMKLGAVEVAELELTEEEKSAVSRESGDAIKLKAQHATLISALKTLDSHAHLKDALLSPKPMFAADTFLDTEMAEEALGIAEEIERCADTIKRSNAEISRQGAVAESLEPWKSLDMPIEFPGTKLTTVYMGTIPADYSFGEVQAALEKASELSELLLVSSDDKLHYTVLITHKSEQTALDAVREYGFAIASLGGMTGTPQENIDLCRKTVENLQKDKETAENTIVGFADKRELLKLGADILASEIGKAEADGKTCGLESTIIMQGWIIADKIPEFEAICKKYDCAWEYEDPTPEEYHSVPVKLANNSFTEPLNMATNMYSLPAYGSIDPNPVMSVFFILFYGIMMADMGYGLLMVAFALLAIKKSRPNGGRKYFFGLMLECGISTFIMGILSGGFFSNAIPTICEMFGKECTIKLLTNPIIDPLNDTNTVLIGSMLLGVVHLFTGMFTNWYMKARDGHFMDGVWDEGTWMVLLIGLALYFAPTLGIGNNNMPGLIMLIVGGLMLIFGSGRNEKGIKKITALFGNIYNGVTGWFGDILSYSRLMALMLAGSVVGQVFNTLAAMPSEGGVTVLSVVAFVLIFIAGHAINFGLNILGCFAHDLRLQCLEFFGKFYQDGGKPFKPLNLNTEHVEVEPTVN